MRPITQSKANQRSRTRAQTDWRQGHREVKQRARNEGFEYMPPSSTRNRTGGFVCACRKVFTDSRHLDSHIPKCGKSNRDRELQEFSAALESARAELNRDGSYQYIASRRDGKSKSHPKKKYQVHSEDIHTTWPKKCDNYSRVAYPYPPDGHKVLKKVPLSAKKQSPTEVAEPYRDSQPDPHSIQDTPPHRTTRLYPIRSSNAPSNSRIHSQGSTHRKYSGPSDPSPRYGSNTRLWNSDVMGPQTRLGAPDPSYAKPRPREDFYSYHSSDLPSESNASGSDSGSVRTPSEY